MRPVGRLALAIAVTLLLGGILCLAAGPLAAVPSLLAFLPLLANRYVGAERLQRIAERRRRRVRPHRAIVPVRGRPVFAAVGGSRLIACSLAKRPPPALAFLS